MNQTPEEKARLEALGHHQAVTYINSLAKQHQEIELQNLREIHCLIFTQSWPEIAGRFRTESVEITGTSYLPSHWQQVPSLAYQVLASLNFRIKQTPPVNVVAIIELAAQAHYDMAAIHPFRDGNGRVARLLLNYVLRYFGLPYVVLPKDSREQYLDTLEAANAGNIMPFVDFVAEQYERTLDRLLKVP